MIILYVFAFFAGIVTMLSPCILPVLPIILSAASTDTKNKLKPIGVIVGFIFSFTIFTLFLSSIVHILKIPSDSLRIFSIFIIFIFGVSLLIAKFQLLLESLFSRLSVFSINTNKKGLLGGFILGISLGLLWTPCVGPILAGVISLAIAGQVTITSFLITFFYALGTALPMFMIIIVGNKIFIKFPWLIKNTKNIQKVFGIVMILTALLIYFNFDRKFQTFILTTFPNYGTGLTKVENNKLVLDSLQNIKTKTAEYIENTNQAPEIIAGGEWFNSAPLKLKDLKGKVVIIDFWTYSCINCQRTLPYLKNWYQKYKDKGLIVIGVHSPEFEFEKNASNVSKAINDFGIKYPVVQDNDFKTWRAYNNQYWPAKYFIDKNGVIRDTHFGEGNYNESEKIIQDLLSENAQQINENIDNPEYKVWSNTPETYIGYKRINNVKLDSNISKNVYKKYGLVESLPENYFSLQGEWKIDEENASPKQNSKLIFNYNSKEVYLVMKNNGKPSKIKVLVDDKSQDFGDDVINGVITVDSDRLYKIVKSGESGKHKLVLEFLDDNTDVYAFTFG